ncbi:MAG: sulfur oxidation c-type cytochrome SoxX [Boseongicola sp.]|nr:sulfur oxidation c-type cytochrome SoxX [Boseongicola sp.]
MGVHRVTGVVAGLALGLLISGSAGAKELIKYKIVDEGIPKALTAKPGDPKAGRKAAINRKQGNCLACHKLPAPEQQFHGEVGPDLKGVAERLSEAEIRLRIVNPKVVNEETIMPSFYRNAGLHRVLKKWQGKTILSAQQVEDIVAYMKTLK